MKKKVLFSLMLLTLLILVILAFAISIPSGGIAYFNFSENINDVWSNINGTGYNYYINSSHYPTFGISGNGGNSSLSLNSGYVVLGNKSLFEVGDGNFTFSIWFNATSNPANMIIFSKWDCNGGSWHSPLCLLQSGVDGSIVCQISQDIIISRVTSSTSFNNNDWHHLVYSKNSSHTFMYINGTFIGESNLSGITSFSNSNNMLIGSCDIGHDVPFTGLIDEFKFFNRSLSEDEILKLYNYGDENFVIPTISDFLVNGTQLYNSSGMLQVNVSHNSSYPIIWVNFSLTSPNGTSYSFINNTNGTFLGGNIWQSANFSFNQNGTYIINIKASDNNSGITSYSNDVLINNSPPLLYSENVSFSPIPINVGDSLNVSCNATDVDGNAPYYFYRWFINQTMTDYQGVTLNGGNTTLNSNITLECVAYDGLFNSSKVNSTTYKVGDLSAPTLWNTSVDSNTKTQNSILLMYLNCDDAVGVNTAYWEVQDPNIILTNYTNSSSLSNSLYVRSLVMSVVGTYTITNTFCKDNSNYMSQNETDVIITVSAGGGATGGTGGGGGYAPSETNITSLLKIKGGVCNFNGACDAGLGETFYSCADDCPLNFDTIFCFTNVGECLKNQAFMPTLLLVILVLGIFYFQLQKNKDFRNTINKYRGKFL